MLQFSVVSSSLGLQIHGRSVAATISIEQLLF